MPNSQVQAQAQNKPDPLSILIHAIAGQMEKSLQAATFDDTPEDFRYSASSSNPYLSMVGFLDRCTHYLSLKATDLVMVGIYFNRLVTKHPDYPITEFNMHLLLSCLIIAQQKYNYDVNYAQPYYAEVAGVSLKILHKAERHFYSFIDWDFAITASTYETYCQALELEPEQRAVLILEFPEPQKIDPAPLPEPLELPESQKHTETIFESALFSAILTEEFEQAASLLSTVKNAPIRLGEGRPFEALNTLVEHQKTRLLHDLLRRVSVIDKTNLLMVATETANEFLARFLLENGALPGRFQSDKNYLFRLAIKFKLHLLIYAVLDSFVEQKRSFIAVSLIMTHWAVMPQTLKNFLVIRANYYNNTVLIQALSKAETTFCIATLKLACQEKAVEPVTTAPVVPVVLSKTLVGNTHPKPQIVASDTIKQEPHIKPVKRGPSSNHGLFKPSHKPKTTTMNTFHFQSAV